MAKLRELVMTVRLMGKRYQVLAIYPDTDDGTEAANALMAREPDLTVLTTADGLILLADKNDKGD